MGIESLAGEIQFALMANRQDTNQIFLGQKAIERNIPGLAVRYDQFAYLPLDPPTDQRVIRKNIDRVANCGGRICSGRRIVFC